MPDDLPVPAGMSVVLEERTVPPAAPAPSWMMGQLELRKIIAALLTGVVCYLALAGDQTATASLLGAFGTIVGMLYGEAAALKKPGEDR